MTLVIVESPTKAKTISKFLGKEYTIESSYGHVRDLPRGELGVDVENNFKPRYIIPRKAQKRVTALKKIAQKDAHVILATDEDREGEAIAWHLTKALNINPDTTERIVFHEITENAIKDALEHPREIDRKLVDAQQARRIIDRLVGYKLSPFLWKKIRGGLSAGRVQSVAVKLIVEREKEIQKFNPQEYWSIIALLTPNTGKNSFDAALISKDGNEFGKLDIKSKKEAENIVSELKSADWGVVSVIKKATQRNPLAPFMTSTLQQDASRRLYFSAKKTMFLAQRLYENGHITYMRTDSLNLSKESLSEAKKWIQKELGKKYTEAAPRVFKTKSKSAQEAHEAIRPTKPGVTPENIKAPDDEQRLYDLIWRRFIASQLPKAVFDATSVTIKADINGHSYALRANGNILRFDGFLAIWKSKISEKKLPELKEKDELSLIEIKHEQHFTEPPARYNEASLVKTLEEYGIGRPSTYAPIISVIQDREYVSKNENRRFEPTEIGVIVNDVLSKHFPRIVDVGFTSDIEEDFDKIANGKKKWSDIVGKFYIPFEATLLQKYKEVKKEEFVEKTDEKCDVCGKDMVVKHSRFGKFLGCSGYPECKNTKTLREPPKTIGMKCPKCSNGEVITRKTKRGKIFYGCSRYPDCDFASWTNPMTEA